jgi:hypothetical protein
VKHTTTRYRSPRTPQLAQALALRDTVEYSRIEVIAAAHALS